MTQKEANDLLILLGKIASFISIFPLVLCFYKWRFFKAKPLIWLFLYFLSGVFLNWFTSAFVDIATKYWKIVGPYLQKLHIDDTFFVDPIYFLRNYVFIGLFSVGIIKDEQTIKVIKWLSISLIIFTFLNTFFIEGYEDYQTIGNTLDNLYKLVISFLVLKRLFNSNIQTKITNHLYFWVYLGFLIIGCIAGLIDFLSNKLVNQQEVIFYQAHIVKDCFVLIAFICFSIGVWKVSGKYKLI